MKCLLFYKVRRDMNIDMTGDEQELLKKIEIFQQQLKMQEEALEKQRQYTKGIQSKCRLLEEEINHFKRLIAQEAGNPNPVDDASGTDSAK